MSRTTHPARPPARRGVRHPGRHRAWWACLNGLVSLGLLCAFVTWGWLVPAVLGANAAVIAALGALSIGVLAADDGTDGRTATRVADASVLTGLVTVGTAGLVAVVGGVATVLLLALGGTSPAVQRLLRDPGAPLRWWRTLVGAAHRRSTTTWRDGHGWT